MQIDTFFFIDIESKDKLSLFRLGPYISIDHAGAILTDHVWQIASSLFQLSSYTASINEYYIVENKLVFLQNHITEIRN